MSLKKRKRRKIQMLGQKLSWVAVFKTFHCRPLGPPSLSCCYREALLDRFCFSPPIDNWQCQSVKCQTLWRRMGVQSDATTTWLAQFSLLSFPSMISHFKKSVWMRKACCCLIKRGAYLSLAAMPFQPFSKSKIQKKHAVWFKAKHICHSLHCNAMQCFLVRKHLFQ